MKFAVTIEGVRKFEISFEETAFYASEGKFSADVGLLSPNKGAYRYAAKYKLLTLKTFDDNTFYHIFISKKRATWLMSLSDLAYPPRMGATGKGFVTQDGAAVMPVGSIKWTVKSAPTGLSNDEIANIMGGGPYESTAR